jgi:hypothetical protein
MTLDEVKKEIPTDIITFARIRVDLEHNSNFFNLNQEFFGIADFAHWWEKNSEAYMISFVVVKRHDVFILINAVDE